MRERERERGMTGQEREARKALKEEALTRPRVKDSANSIKSFLNMLSKLR